VLIAFYPALFTGELCVETTGSNVPLYGTFVDFANYPITSLPDFFNELDDLRMKSIIITYIQTAGKCGDATSFVWAVDTTYLTTVLRIAATRGISVYVGLALTMQVCVKEGMNFYSKENTDVTVQQTKEKQQQQQNNKTTQPITQTRTNKKRTNKKTPRTTTNKHNKQNIHNINKQTTTTQKKFQSINQPTKTTTTTATTTTQQLQHQQQ